MKSIYRTVRILSVIFLVGRSLMSQEMIITKTDGSWESVPVNNIEHIKFRETGTVTDIDGNVYKTVKIGNQWWMAENLRVTQYNNGDGIAYVEDVTKWSATNSGAYCYYDNDDTNVPTYGYLYNWYAVETGNLAPTGWRVPTDKDRETLAQFISDDNGGYGKTGDDWLNVGGHLKSLSGWVSLISGPDINGTDDYGFNALPGGYRRSNAQYVYVGYHAYFWTQTMDVFGRPWAMMLTSANANFYKDNMSNRSTGFSVRCVKDVE